MSHLELHLLGDFQVTLDGHPLAGFRSEKVRALLAYLAVESECSHQRPALAALLWGDYQDAAALSSLRTALHNLRQLLDPLTGDLEETGLIVTRTRVQFRPPSPPHYWSDLAEFDALALQPLPHVHAEGVCCDACLARLTRMAQLYGGDFLGSFIVSDALEFETWYTIQRETRHRQACDALHALITHHKAMHDYPSVVRYARQILALEPWLEADHRHLMRALALTLAMAASHIVDAPAQVQLILSDVAYAPGTRRVLTGHTGPVNSVAVTADGGHILSASADGTLILWDAATGERVHRFQGHAGAVHDVVWLPGERQALSASIDGSLIVWDVASGTPIRRLEGHDGAVRCVSLSPIPLPESDHLGALSGSDDATLILWDVETGEIVRRLTGHSGAVLSVAISPDVLPGTGQHMILSGSMAQEVIMWDFPSGGMRYDKRGYENTQAALDDQQQNGHFDAVWAVGFTPDGRAFSASQDEYVMLWNPETGALEQATHLAAGLFSGAAGEGGSTLLLGTLNSQMLVVDAVSSQVLLELYGHASRVLALALMPKQRSAVSGGEDGTLRLWNLHGGAETRIFPYPGDLVAATAIDVAPDQQQGLVAWMDNSISVWDMDSGTETCRLRGHQEMPFAGAVFFPDSRRVASGSGDIYGPAKDNTVRIWDVETCQELAVLSGHTDRLWDIAISPNGQWIVSGAHDGTIRLWDVDRGRGQVLLNVLPMAARSVAFSPDGTLVAVGLAKGSSDNPVYDVHLVERVSGAEVRRLTGHTAVVTDLDFSPDGRQLLSASVNGEMILWDVVQGLRLRSLIEHTNAVMAVDFHPDGHLAASGSADSSVILWDTVTGDALRRYTAQAKSILSIAFAPDGKSLFSVGDDLPNESVREIRLDISADALLDWVTSNRHVPELTCEQRAQYHIEPLCLPASPPPPE